jgi:NADH-quinone oxidoreductase subunit G
LVRDGGDLRPVSWERALQAAAALGRHKGHVGALVGGQATNEEGFLLTRLMREGLNSPSIDSRSGEAIPLHTARALAAPALQATVVDIEFAHTVLVLGCEPLDDAPILDLRIRKGVRRRGVNLVMATARPSALDVNARRVIRYGPDGEAAFIAELTAALTGGGGGEDVRSLAQLLREGGEDIVIVWGEQIGAAAGGLLALADALGLAGRNGAGLLEIPSGANGRGLREAGVLPNAGPGYSELDATGLGAAGIATAAEEGEITALYLLQTDPIRDLPDAARWNRAMHRAALVVAHASVLTEGIREHANVVFPAESYAEKEGTVVHPDGRLQRLRTAIAHPGDVRAGWSVVADIAKRVGLDLQVLTSPMAFAQLTAAVPFYEGLTLDEIAGRGVRWPNRPQASAMPAGERPLADEPKTAATPTAAAAANGSLKLGRYRSIWASPEVEISPALHYTVAHQQVELAPEDARRLGIANGESVEVSQNGTRLQGRAAVRTGVPAGVAFLAEGIAADSANLLTEDEIEVHKP